MSVTETPAAASGVRTGPIATEARALVRLAVPIMLIALINMGMGVTDTLMVAMAYGSAALAAVAVGSDFYSIIFYLGAGTIGGLAPFYTAAVVKGDAAERVRLERTGQGMAVLLAAILVPLVWTAPGWLGHLNLDPTLLAEGRGYTRAMALTLMPMLGIMLYRTLLTAAERPRVFLKVTAAMLPLNALLNLAFMKGWGPIPAFGPTGAGISSMVVALATLTALIVIARRTAPVSTAERYCSAIRWHDLLPVLRTGLPIGIAMVTELGIFLAATLYAARLGAADVAAHTLTLRVAGVAYAIPAALLQASMVRMARAEAAGDPVLRRSVARASFGLSLGAGAFLFLSISSLATPLADGFFDMTAAGRAAAGLSAGLLLALGMMHFIVNPGAVAAGLLRGRKDTRAPMTFTLAGYWVIGVPVGLWLCEVRELGTAGIWSGLFAGMFATTVLMLLRVAAGTPDRLERS